MTVLVVFGVIIAAAVVVGVRRREEESSLRTGPTLERSDDPPEVEPTPDADVEEALEHLARMLAQLQVAKASTNLEQAASTVAMVNDARSLREAAANVDCVGAKKAIAALAADTGVKLPLLGDAPDADAAHDFSDDAAEPSPNDVPAQLFLAAEGVEALCPADAAP